MIIQPYSELDELENTVANFPFLANSYYWPCTDVSPATAIAEVTGGPSYDPAGALGVVSNGVNIANAAGSPSDINLSRMSGTDSMLLFVSGKPDFLTTSAGIIVNSPLSGASLALSIMQNATQTILSVGDGNDGNAATIANVELQDQLVAIMVKNPTGSSVSADYYIVAENGSAVATGAITMTTPLANLGWVDSTSIPLTLTKYTAGTGVLHAFGLLKFATVPSTTEISSFLSWMHWQIKTNQKRGMYPGFKGKA